MAGPSPLKFDPAIEKLAYMNKNRWRYFRWTPRTAFVTFMFVGFVPGVMLYAFGATDGKYNMRAKLRGDTIKEWVDPSTNGCVDTEKGHAAVGVYHNAQKDSDTVSILWGRQQGFLPRVSRAVASMPIGLLKSSPTTIDGYDGKGLTNAMGILGRNKGLEPWTLIFKHDATISSHMESASTWAPRPAKVLRSFYKVTLKSQYGGLGDDYVNATVELALIMSDMPHWAINRWLCTGLEHQSLEVNKLLAEEILPSASEDEKVAALSAHYQSSYVAMIVSLNYMDSKMKHYLQSMHVSLRRPEILCTGILLKKRGHAEPSWWNKEAVARLRVQEAASLSSEHDWRFTISKLLGLNLWPKGFEDHQSWW
ncbi:hypothetical protein H2198_010633 [Neophaeococcomyces mojaviensis]|uniref:Uncharacterized protein n=1 Tax=Neophaeococcomyces mojaviensis TaxID=3383035 RepID=A0ACC2ZR36_9EURO|nr:hypothetical protein H2198_010633 [Knufia sp. JES_112]